MDIFNQLYGETMKSNGLSFPDNFFKILGLERMNPQPKKKRIALKRNSKAWKLLVLECFERDHYTCQWCGKFLPFEYLSPCHIKSVGSGGHDVLGNLKTGCRECHLKEHGGEFLK